MRQKIDKKYGQKLYELRKAVSSTRGDFSKLFGVSQQQIEKYENGQNRLRLEYVEMVCRKFNIPYAYFFENEKALPKRLQKIT